MAIPTNAPGRIPISPNSWWRRNMEMLSIFHISFREGNPVFSCWFPSYSTSNAELRFFTWPDKLWKKQSIVLDVMTLQCCHCDVLYFLYLCSGTWVLLSAERLHNCHWRCYIRAYVTGRLCNCWLWSTGRYGRSDGCVVLGETDLFFWEIWSLCIGQMSSRSRVISIGLLDL